MVLLFQANSHMTTPFDGIRREPAQPPPPDEPDLVARARAGELTSYEELMRRYQGRIYGLIYHLTGHHHDTEELAQTVFVKAFRALPRFKGDSAFFTWLYRIAVNTTLNQLKARGRRREISLDDPDAGAERGPDADRLTTRDSPVRDAGLSELRKKLNAALETLSEKHRAVVVMHDMEGLPHDEIARIMKTSPGTIRSRLFYARQQLQRELREYGP